MPTKITHKQRSTSKTSLSLCQYHSVEAMYTWKTLKPSKSPGHSTQMTQVGDAGPPPPPPITLHHYLNTIIAAASTPIVAGTNDPWPHSERCANDVSMCGQRNQKQFINALRRTGNASVREKTGCGVTGSGVIRSDTPPVGGSIGNIEEEEAGLQLSIILKCSAQPRADGIKFDRSSGGRQARIWDGTLQMYWKRFEYQSLCFISFFVLSFFFP